MPLTAPEPLTDAHDVAPFDGGMPSLDDWLKRRARGNQVAGATRSFVAAEERRVVAYYAVASGNITVGAAPVRAATGAHPARRAQASDRTSRDKTGCATSGMA